MTTQPVTPNSATCAEDILIAARRLSGVYSASYAIDANLARVKALLDDLEGAIRTFKDAHPHLAYRRIPRRLMEQHAS